MSATTEPAVKATLRVSTMTPDIVCLSQVSGVGEYHKGYVLVVVMVVGEVEVEVVVVYLVVSKGCLCV